MTNRFARLGVIFLGFAFLTCQSQATVRDDLNHAIALRNQGAFKEAVTVLKQIVNSTSPSTSPAETEEALSALGSAYLGAGNYSEARKCTEKALRLVKAANPENLKEEAAVLDQLGLVYMKLDDSSHESKVRDQALNLYEQLGDHEGIFEERNSQANLAIKTMKLRQAHELMDKAFEQMPFASKFATGDMATFYSNAGWLAYTESRSDAAFEAYKKALQSWTSAYGPHDYKVGETYIQIGKVYLQRNNVVDADSNIRRGMGILKQALGDNDPITLSALVPYSRLLDVEGQHDQAAQIQATVEQSLHGKFGIGSCTRRGSYEPYPRL